MDLSIVFVNVYQRVLNNKHTVTVEYSTPWHVHNVMELISLVRYVRLTESPKTIQWAYDDPKQKSIMSQL